MGRRDTILDNPDYLEDIPESGLNSTLYSKQAQDLAAALVCKVRLLHSSVCGLRGVPWRRAMTQLLAAQQTMCELDEELVRSVVPRRIDDE